MEPTKYFKVNWILPDPDISNGGKYNDCTNGFFFASSTDSIFTVMDNICQYFLQKLDKLCKKENTIDI